MTLAYRPKVIHKHIEETQQDHQQDSTPFCLEPDDDHDTGNKSQQADENPPEPPLAREDESDKKKDEQNTTGKLDIHFAILLVELWQPGWNEPLAHPRVRNHHQQTANNAQIAEEEVQVSHETVCDGLGDHDTQEAGNGVFGAFADNDQERAHRHGDHVHEQEYLRDPPWNCAQSEMYSISNGLHQKLTPTPVSEVGNLILPLCHNTQGVLDEGHNDQKAPNRRQISIIYFRPNVNTMQNI